MVVPARVLNACLICVVERNVRVYFEIMNTWSAILTPGPTAGIHFCQLAIGQFGHVEERRDLIV